MSLAKSLLAEMYGVCLCLSIEATVQKLQKSIFCHMIADEGGGGATYGESSFYLQLKCQMYKQFFLYKYDET
jgi:hypothetical protein